jgi:pyruvate dehydrogenase E2 component (dihydrolipoamide acetyltransferase)
LPNAKDNAMPIELTMPRLSDTMQQGTVVKWNVKEGQKVKAGDVIADIETDKATMELPTYEDGTVAKLVVPEGQSVAVGTLIMVMAGAGEDVGAVKASAGSGSTKAASVGAAKPDASSSGTSTATLEPASTNGSHGASTRVFASPLAKKIAAETGVDLSRVQGSGPGGRIIRKDVEQVASGGTPMRGASGGVGPSSTGVQGAVVQRAATLPPASAALTTKLIPLSNMRRVIAQRLVESKTTIPHYQVTVDVDMEPLGTLRQQLNDQLASQGVKLSVNDFLVRACALAMHQHPYVNARWVNQQAKHGQIEPAIEYVAEVNIGVAIALPVQDDGTGGGLVVATLRNADQIGLRQISAQTKQLSEKARTKGLAPNEMSDATFTISNLGMFGVSHFTAIINPPNVAILAVGAAIDKPVVKDGKIVPGKVMSMTMSSDHRVVDGAMAAQYLGTVKELLEKPAGLLV